MEKELFYGEFNKFIIINRNSGEMKNCVVKMILKNKNRIPHQETNRSEPIQEISSSQTVLNSRNLQQKEGLCTQFKNLIGVFETFTKNMVKTSKPYEIQPRDREIVFQLPEIKGGERIQKRELEMWVTNLCREIFSSAFHYFQRGSMSYDQAKIYCSENMIRNIIRLNSAYSLNSKEVQWIDEHIEEGVTAYLLAKYPMTETQVVNNALESEIKEIDNIEALENDIFYYSQDSYGFELRDSGNYNDLIMKLLNDLIKRLDERQAKPEKKRKNLTFYEQFYDFMKKGFGAIESRDWMEGSAKEDQKQTAKDDHFKKADDQKYQARVKSYTSWNIGRKISENVTQYTETEISSKHMIIKSPAILRILTKWCDELWAKFDKKNYFLDRTQNIKCQKGGNVNTYFSWMKTIINDMIEEEKIEIEKFLEQIFQNNYDQQAVHLFRSLKGNYFTHVERIQKAAGVFTINIVNNLHSYILLYLNRLIHGLLRVSKRVFDKQLIGRPRWTSPPNLISFKIGDLMRCKIGSQQKQILKLYKYYNDLSCNQPSTFKIIRIKNRLREGTNDILMNVRFKNLFICEIQLAVNSDHSNFIKCSNKYNHFIYEVKRSIFGPLTEFCSIWRSLDGRCKVYQKIANSRKEQIVVQSQKTSCQISGQNHRMGKFNQPFVCSTCQHTYSHSNYIWPHQRCQICIVFTQCCKCKINSMRESQLKSSLFKNVQSLGDVATKISAEEEIPRYGVCFLIESKNINPQKFVKLSIKGKTGLYYRNAKNEIDLITQINTQKEIQIFRDKYVIFVLPFQDGRREVQISEVEAKNDYLVPKTVKNIYKKQKEFISLINEEITDITIEKIMKGTPSQRQNIKFLELPDNQLTHVNFICSNFPNLTKLILSRNKIADIEQVGTLENLEQLNVRDNFIETLPLSICRLKKLQNLNIRNNKINVIPEQISQLTQLTKLELNQLSLKQLPLSFATMTQLQYLDLTKNKLGLVPQQLKQLTSLTHLGISNNQIASLPDWIGDLKKLRVLEANKNKLQILPESMIELTNLYELQLENNCFKELDFKCPESLNIILLNDNKISVVKEIFLSNSKNLVKLEMNKNQITGLPRTISICKSLKHLRINQNKLTTLPSIFGIFLPALELIELNKNQFVKFPKELNSCPELVQIQISHNNIEDQIPDKFMENCSKLQKLDLSKTKISSLPLKFSNLSSLKRLNISQTKISCQSLEVLSDLKFIEELVMSNMGLNHVPSSLKEQHYLQTLNLRDNQIERLDDDFFNNLTHLRTIIFENNKLVQVPTSLQYSKRLKIINFNNNCITDFPESAFQLPRLQRIDMSNNLIERIDTNVSISSTVLDFNLKGNKISYISEIFFKNAENLVHLDLSKNALHTVPQLLRKCTKLVSTNFQNNPLQASPEEIAAQLLNNFADSIQEVQEVIDQQPAAAFQI